MKRRALLAGLVSVTGGCVSGVTVSDSDSETPTSTETATEEPTDTAPETPAGPRATEEIDTAQDRFSAAVYVYCDGVSSDLLDVSAATDSFDARSVLLRLDRVQTAIGEADRAAATADERAEIASLRDMRRFLTHATDLQAWLIDGHTALSDASDELSDDGDEELIESKLDTVDRAIEESEQSSNILADEIDPASTAVTEAVDGDELDAKRTQFSDERSVLTQLRDAVSSMRTAIDDLSDARTEADDGEYDDAAELAGDAADRLDDVVGELEDIEQDLPQRADAFEDVADDLLELAQDHEEEASELEDDYE